MSAQRKDQQIEHFPIHARSATMPPRLIYSAGTAATFIKATQATGWRDLHAAEVLLLRQALRHYHPEGAELAELPPVKHATVMAGRLFATHLDKSWRISAGRFGEEPFTTFTLACRGAIKDAIANMLDARDPIVCWGVQECSITGLPLIRQASTVVVAGCTFTALVSRWLRDDAKIIPSSRTVRYHLQHTQEPTEDMPVFRTEAMASRFRNYFMHQDLIVVSAFGARKGNR